MSGAAPRRDNGLRAETYERLADVDTHLVDMVLERLRDAQVAAYSAPTPGRRGYYGETVAPLAPSDSVWVDSARRDQARVVVDGFLAEVADEVAVESAWAGIVADFERTSQGPVPPWPASEDVDDDEGDPPVRGGLEAGRTPERTSPPYDTSVHRVEDHDHFEPPPPPPLPSVDPVTRFAWAGALGGPAVLLLAALAGLPLAGWVGALAVAAFMAGFVTLVARMKERPPTDSGPDDGAVV
jgi:hypothetical protein